MSELEIPVEGAVLSARLSVPAEGPAPAIVLLHGPESIAAWKKARPDADVIVIPGTGHEPAVDEVVDPLYERTMAGWLKRLA